MSHDTDPLPEVRKGIYVGRGSTVILRGAAATAAPTRVYPFRTYAALYCVSGSSPVKNNTAAGFFVFPVTRSGKGTTLDDKLDARTADAEDQ